MSQPLGRVAIGLGTAIALISALHIGGGAWQQPADGLPDAGALTFWILQLAILGHTILGIRILGIFIVSGFISPQSDDTVSRSERARLVHAAALAGLWVVTALVAAVSTLATVLALPLNEVLRPGVIGTYLWALPPSRAYIYTVVIAVVIGLWATLATSLNSVAVLSALAIAGIVSPLLNSHSASLGDHSLAVTSSVIHGVAMSLWVGALFALGPYIKAGSQGVIARFSKLAIWSVVALAISGAAAAYTRMDSVSDLWASGYGQLVLIKIALFVALMLFAKNVRRDLVLKKSVVRMVTFEMSIMAIAVGVGVALHSTPMSRASQAFPSAAEEILGFTFPPKPTYSSMIFGWHPEWAMLTAMLVVSAMYIVGVIRLRRNNISWNPLRTTSFVFGAAMVLWTTCSGIAMYAQISFSAHMIQHMVLSMVAPMFLVSGTPITLALRALPSRKDATHRGSREWLLAGLHSRYAQIITNPLIVLAIFTFGLYGMYFTSLFATLMSSHIGHIFMEFHFLIAGTLFSFVIIGSDPAPREIPYWARLLMILVALSLHAFFAIAIMQSNSAIGSAWYSQVQPPWITDPVSDSTLGGGIAWAAGEVPTLIMMVMVAFQWSQSDSRTAKRLDRAADRDGDTELIAYNKRLSELNGQGATD